MPITINGSGTITGISAGGLPDAIITQPELAAGVAGNGPAFSAYPSAGVSASTGTWTKIPFNIEDFDTNSNYDNVTNYRFTPTVAGYYQINFLVTFPNMGNDIGITSSLYKNGSSFKIGSTSGTTNNVTNSCEGSVILYLNGSTDYIEVYANQGSGSTQTIAVANNFSGSQTIQISNYFNASMIRSA